MKKFHKFLIKLNFLLLISFNLDAAIIKEIRIDGNNRVSKETIKVYGEIKINENVDEQRLNKILNNLYSTNFFEDVKISEDNGILKIIVKEYPVVNQLIIIEA